jgi:alkaline phosphatase D
MKLITLILFLTIAACGSNHKQSSSTFTLAFGSCNRQNLKNELWTAIDDNHPDVWVWGGDNIYSDTEDMDFLRENYLIQKHNPAYKHFTKTTDIIGSWDDHDYGLNDGGKNYSKKAESQQLFLDFMDVPKDSPRRKQAGIYASHDYQIGDYSIKIIVLDTRYFRSDITPDPHPSGDHRYVPNAYGKGTMLGQEQWQWLEKQLNQSTADFNVISSSIQFLSPYHGFEKWANMPHEMDKMEQIIKTSHAKNVIILSGDRHISEFSKKNIEGMDYPLLDFTSSGLTHAYNKEKIEDNPYRVGHNVVVNSFGIIRFDFKTKQVVLEIRGKDNQLLESYTQYY